MSASHPIRTRELVGMMSMVMALSAMAIDFMTPAFGEIRTHFQMGSESTAAAQIITVFFLGEVAQVIYGPLSDRYGRLPILRLGFAVYVAGSIASALAPTFAVMLAARLVWGLGAAALQVSAASIIRDRFRGDEMARVMSLIMAIFLIVPVFAPLGGAALLAASSWQVVFAFPAGLAVIVFGWSLRLNESRPESNIVAMNVSAIGRAARFVLSNRVTRRYTLGAMMLFAAFSTFLSSFERVIGELYGRPSLFPIAFGTMTAVAAMVMLGNRRLVNRLGAKRTSVVMLSINLTVAALFVVGSVASQGIPPLGATLGLLTIILAVNTAASVNFGSLALEPMGEQAGMAAAFYGSFYVGGGAALGWLIDRQLSVSLTPWAIALVVSAAGALMLMPTSRLRRAEHPIEV
ncbi:MAG: MFS transporter [Acidimicrobiia bacterium]|nr:MFS transporter [Acidimicrobiia bacterium]